MDERRSHGDSRIREGYDYTFDFGRYRDTHMLIFGEGILRTWSNWEAFLKKQSGHGSGRTVTWQTPGAYDAAMIKYFEDLAAKGQQTNQTVDYTEYKLASDYSIFGTNCSTLSCEAMSAAESQTGVLYKVLIGSSVERQAPLRLGPL